MRVQHTETLVVEAEGSAPPRRERLDQDVGPPDEVVEHDASFGGSEIEREAELPGVHVQVDRGRFGCAVVVQERLHGPCCIHALRRFDVHDGGAEIAQASGGRGPRKGPREVDDSQAVERWSTLTRRSRRGHRHTRLGAQLADDFVAVLVEARCPSERPTRCCRRSHERARGRNRRRGERGVYDVLPVTARRELRARDDVLGRGDRREKQPPVDGAVEQLAPGVLEAEGSDGALDQLEVRCGVGVDEESGAVTDPILHRHALVDETLLLQPRHQAAGVGPEGRTEEKSDHD